MAKYTCNEYRQEMRLVGLKRQLESGELSEIEKQKIENEIKRLVKEMAMD